MPTNKLEGGNSFGEGMNLSISDFLLQATMARYLQNFRLVGIEGNNFVLSNLKGTESKFSLSTGFIPVACTEFNNVLYIASWKQSSAELELGSYPSPDYVSPSSGNNNVYRPFKNLSTSNFRTAAFGTTTFPKIQRLEIQPDYDNSVNLCFTIAGLPPRIVNSKFDNKTLAIIPDRPGAANTNTYTFSSVEKETHLQIFSDKILDISLAAINEGGKVKCGNYVYVFKYMSEDFNKTAVVGQSSICQIAFGNSDFTRKGGDETDETTLRTILDLANVDTDFKFLKVYALYSSGQEGVQEQYLEFTQPLTITGEAMQFIHTGFEELREVTIDEFTLDYSPIAAAECGVQIGGYYILGNVTQVNYDYTIFRDAAANISPIFGVKAITLGALPGYADPLNVYNYMGSFGRESYPYGIVFIMPGGVLSPMFPTRGRIINSQVVGPSPSVSSYVDQPNGIITFPYSNHFLPFDNSQLQAKYVEFDMASVPVQIKSASVGFFFVRGERRPAMLTQGLLIPTVRVPTMDRITLTGDDDSNDNYYWDNRTLATDTSVFKHLPSLDSMMEAYRYDRVVGFESDVVDGANKISAGYMPIFVNDIKVSNAAYPEIWSTQHWALISGEALLNEPAYVTSLQRDNLSLHQLAKITFDITGNVTPKFKTDLAAATGLYYKFKTFLRYTGTSLTSVTKLVYTPGGTFASGNEFISSISTRLRYGPDSSIIQHYLVKQNYLSFFGMIVPSLQDSGKSAANPIGGNGRITAAAGSNLLTTGDSVTSGPGYNSNGKTANAGFLVNIYPGALIPTGEQLYPTIDGISYRQVSKRYAWADVPPTNKIAVFGGDCYVGKIARKLNQAPYSTRTELNITNINAGIMPEWYQESKYNLALRQPKQFDASETEDRSFFPQRNQGDFIKYRESRLPETLSHSQGYSRLLTPKGFFTIPALAPFVKSRFFARLLPSEKHIPNAFRNGYRSFLESKMRDYDTSMGEIVAIFNHHGNLLVIFEHGVGITAIEQRVQTGQDQAGPVVLEATTVLPPTLQHEGFSREIGCQNHLSLVQTPNGVYGVDVSRDKIWVVTDKLRVISDGVVDAFIKGNLTNPRSGYDPEHNEVLFTTDTYTLAFKEGASAFSFFTFRPAMYARRHKEMYSFLADQAHKHNAAVYTIYGEQKDCVVEFVINQNVNMTKVLDWLNIISNAVAPKKVEVYTMKNPHEKLIVPNTAAMNQYTFVDDVVDPVMQEPFIKYKDKKFSIQIPNVKVYNAVNSQDNWGIDGRMRNVYFVVRLTYNTTETVRLASVMSTLRYSFS